MDFYHDLITQKSFTVLRDLKKNHDFILIGGWAVWLYAHTLKSKDIDIVIEYEELEKLKRDFIITKNDRLKKYEVKVEEVDIDLYLPFYSNPGIPAEEIKNYKSTLEGFTVPTPEILLILKQVAFFSRRGSPKGEKDKIDLFSLIIADILNWKIYKLLITQYHQERLLEHIRVTLKQTVEVPELELNRLKTSKLKRKVLDALK